MDKYAIYSYRFKDAKKESQLLPEENSLPDSTEEQRKVCLNNLFGDNGNPFSAKKVNKNGSTEYPCTVMSRSKQFVLLRLERPKTIKVYEKGFSHPGEVAPINEAHIPSNPFIFIIFDFRPGSKCRVAISIKPSLWRETDDVATIIQDSINRILESQNRGFRVLIQPTILPVNFCDHSRKQIKVYRLAVTKFTIYLTNGKVEPKVEDIIKKDEYLKNLMNNIFKSKAVEMNLEEPDGKLIADENSRFLEHMMTLVASEPKGPFRMKMSYSDGSTYVCGKDIRMEFDMDEETFFSLLGNPSLFKEYRIDTWFDKVNNKITREIDAQ